MWFVNSPGAVEPPNLGPEADDAREVSGVRQRPASFTLRMIQNLGERLAEVSQGAARLPVRALAAEQAAERWVVARTLHLARPFSAPDGIEGEGTSP